MPRDSDNFNAPPRGPGGPGGRSGGGKGRSGAPRNSDKKDAKRGFAPRGDRADGGERGERSFGKKPGFGGKPSFGKPSFGKPSFGKPSFGGGSRPSRDGDDRPRGDRPFSPRPPRDGADRPRGDRPYGERKFDDRGPRKDFGDRPRGDRPFSPRPPRDGGDRPRGDRPYGERKFDDRGPRKDFGDRPRGDRPFSPRPPRDGGDRPRGDRPYGERKFEDRGPRKDFGDRPRGDRPFSPRPPRDGDDRPRGDRPYGERKFDDRGPRKDFGDRPRGDRPFSPRPPRDGADRPRGDRPFGERKFDDRGPRKDFGDRPRGDRPFSPRPPRDGDDRPRGDRPGGRDFGGRSERRFDGPDRSDMKPWARKDDRDDRPARGDRDGGRSFDKPRFDRPRQDRDNWHERPRRDSGFGERPRRDNEDDSRIFAKRPAFGGRSDFQPRRPDDRKPRPVAAPKAGERVAKVISRAGLCSRRDAEEWVTQGRVAVNGRVINSPALDVTTRDVITVDGKPLPAPERTRLFLYHKPRGLMTTHADPEGRPTVFDNLPEGLPRLISIGRLDFNTEGLLLLTNDGGLARTLELPETAWLRRYRVRAFGDINQAQLDELQKGVEVDGVKYGPIEAKLERDSGPNVWIVFAMREGKNREVRNVLAHLGLEVNRLIRISYGPFQLADLEEGKTEEVKTRVLREQLGEKIAKAAGADFGRQLPSKGDVADDPVVVKKLVLKRSTVADAKGRRVIVQRAGGDDTPRRSPQGDGFGPPRPPKRGYHGKRDFKPRED